MSQRLEKAYPFPSIDLPWLSLRDLTRQPGPFVDRVARGERFIVTKHGRPIATLQPLDGYVVDPRAGVESDICGSPLGNPRAEAEKLTRVQREMLRNANRLHQVTTADIPHSERGWRVEMDELELRGLAKRTETRHGLYLTGRGMVLQEWLNSEAARIQR